MVAENTRNEGWVSRQLRKVPSAVLLALFAYLLVDWKALREDGLVLGLKANIRELMPSFLSEILVLIFAVAWYAVLKWLYGRAKLLDTRRVGIRIGSRFGWLCHDRIANERS